MVVLDTCAIIEICKSTPTFTTKIKNIMEAGAYILSISFAEIACKMKLGKLEMDVPTKALYHAFNQIKNIEIIDINVNHWLNSIDLEWPDNKDPADRLLIAFATEKKIPIVTSDKKIKQFYKNIIW